MTTDSADRSRSNEAAEGIANLGKRIAEVDEELKQLEEDIHDAERKSKAVIRHPDP
jgi:uncharacterized coiled-coil DUF342 family protein